jgi:hypothetical protein
MIDRREVPVDVEHARVLLDGPRSETATALCGRLENESSGTAALPDGNCSTDGTLGWLQAARQEKSLSLEAEVLKLEA